MVSGCCEGLDAGVGGRGKGPGGCERDRTQDPAEWISDGAGGTSSDFPKAVLGPQPCAGVDTRGTGWLLAGLEEQGTLGDGQGGQNRTLLPPE